MGRCSLSGVVPAGTGGAARVQRGRDGSQMPHEFVGNGGAHHGTGNPKDGAEKRKVFVGAALVNGGVGNPRCWIRDLTSWYHTEQVSAVAKNGAGGGQKKFQGHAPVWRDLARHCGWQSAWNGGVQRQQVVVPRGHIDALGMVGVFGMSIARAWW